MSWEKPLWAPWRMEYLRGPAREGCPFCRLATSGPPQFREELVLVARPHAFVCLNRFPFQAGHLLVIPRRHVDALEALSDEEYEALMALLRESVVTLKRALTPAGINLGFNLGKAAGAGIADHVHGHLVPRWLGDINFMPVLAETAVLPEHLQTTWLTLRAAFEAVAGEKAALP